MSATTITNRHALLGLPARMTSQAVNIVVRGSRIADIRPAGAAGPEGAVIDGTDRLATAGLPVSQ